MSSSLLVKKLSVVKTITSDWKYSVKLGSDKATASGSYKDDYVGWTDRMPFLGSGHPDIRGMILIEIDANREEGDLIKVDLKYESSDISTSYPGRPPNLANQKRYALEITSGEEHLLTADIYKNLPEEEVEALMGIANGPQKEEYAALKALIVSPAGISALEKIRTGFIARKSSGLIWVEKFATKNLSNVEYSKINKIDTPSGLPNPQSGKWLYLGSPATQTDDGEFYNLEKRWEYAPLGWDTDIYT